VVNHVKIMLITLTILKKKAIFSTDGLALQRLLRKTQSLHD